MHGGVGGARVNHACAQLYGACERAQCRSDLIRIRMAMDGANAFSSESQTRNKSKDLDRYFEEFNF